MSKIKGIIRSLEYINTLKAVTEAYHTYKDTVNLGITNNTPLLVKR